MALTEEQKKTYVEGGGLKCPYCGSRGITAESVADVDGSLASVAAGCPDCGKHWTDIYTLTDVEESEV